VRVRIRSRAPVLVWRPGRSPESCTSRGGSDSS
jgi:hypothetical protein